MTRRYDVSDSGVSRSDAVELSLDHLGESAKAWKVRDGDGRIHWLPKSQCSLDNHQSGTIFLVPEWLAKEKGLL